MSNRSPKLAFMKRGQDHEQDMFDDLINVPRTEYKPTVTADRMHKSLAKTRNVRGGLGSSKTRSVCEHVNDLCLKYPGSLHYIGRKDITSLKITTQREFIEKVVSPETILTFNVNENTLFYKNGSQVLFRECKEPDKVKSLELTSFMIDEADENVDGEIYEKLLQRLRQKIYIDGKLVIPPYVGFLVYNPIDENHWLYELAHEGFNETAASEIDPKAYTETKDVEDFRFDTYENAANLPPNYIADLCVGIAPWDIDRLIHGHWGQAIKGKPVYHGFTKQANVRKLELLPWLPLRISWDFGYGHPAISFAQYDPMFRRYFKLREWQGRNMQLKEVVEEAYFPIMKQFFPGVEMMIHTGDPHGKDQKDTGLPSVEYLRVHHNIFLNVERQRILKGQEEIQHMITARAPLNISDPEKLESCFLVDESCKISILAYTGSYYRDKEGIPVKDGFYDHLPDTDRYNIVKAMSSFLINRAKKKRKKPRNRFTGY